MGRGLARSEWRQLAVVVLKCRLHSLAGRLVRRAMHIRSIGCYS
jgi:hypothetical protein